MPRMKKILNVLVGRPVRRLKPLITAYAKNLAFFSEGANHIEYTSTEFLDGALGGVLALHLESHLELHLKAWR